MVCDGITGRLEVAQELIKILKLENQIKVTPVDSQYWKSIYFADRPRSERLTNEKLKLRGLNVMRDWRVCLNEYVNEYYKDYLN
jgi:dTDP-4-dehydrorhamnose reductase